MEAVLAAVRGRRFDEFFEDPVLSAACLLLILVSVAWILIVRRVGRRLDQAARAADVKVDRIRPPRDIWSAPP